MNRPQNAPTSPRLPLFDACESRCLLSATVGGTGALAHPVAPSPLAIHVRPPHWVQGPLKVGLVAKTPTTVSPKSVVSHAVHVTLPHWVQGPIHG